MNTIKWAGLLINPTFLYLKFVEFSTKFMNEETENKKFSALF